MDTYRAYMGPKTPEEYRAYYREKRRAERNRKRRRCATPGCLNMTLALHCRRCAALAREDRLFEEGRGKYASASALESIGEA